MGSVHDFFFLFFFFFFSFFFFFVKDSALEELRKWYEKKLQMEKSTSTGLKVSRLTLNSQHFFSLYSQLLLLDNFL